MGFRFRKSVNVGPVRVTASGKGVGVPGARAGIGADGKERVTFSLPGTGISYQKTVGKRAGCCGFFAVMILVCFGLSACTIVSAIAQ